MAAPRCISGQMRLASKRGLTRSAGALIAIAKTAEQPPEKQRHDGGGVRASSDGDMDVMISRTAGRLDCSTIVGRCMCERTAFGMDAREFRAHEHQLR